MSCSKFCLRVVARCRLRPYSPFTCIPHDFPVWHLADLPAPKLQCRFFTRGTFRGAKRRETINRNDLPQGALPLEPIPLEKNAPKYPTVVLQARTNMRKFENCVLLTRVGGFYELYFEHAEEYGPLLNLKVAQKKTNAGPVSMVRHLDFVLTWTFSATLTKKRCIGWLPVFPARSLPQSSCKRSQLLCGNC